VELIVPVSVVVSDVHPKSAMTMTAAATAQLVLFFIVSLLHNVTFQAPRPRAALT